MKFRLQHSRHCFIFFSNGRWLIKTSFHYIFKSMLSLKVDLGDRSYPIYVGAGICRQLGEMLSLYKAGRRFAVITNTVVDELYGEPVMASFRQAKLAADKFVIADGERYKTLKVLNSLVGEMLERRCDRNTVVVALGGGVTIDLAGFAAASFMRGVDFVAVPTTLLAQVDASIGGKVGVNHRLGKNMIGAFHQPRMVWLDLDTLQTLPSREIVCGLAEVIKHAIIMDRVYFEKIEKQIHELLNLSRQPLEEAIYRSCEIKAEVIGQDEREHGLRTILNFGHTIGHGLETATNYRQFRHGEAVLIGMLAEAHIAWKSGRMIEPDFFRIEKLFTCIPLNASFAGIDMTKILGSISNDKKASHGVLKIVLPLSIGRCETTSDFNPDLIAPAIEYALSRFVEWNGKG
jgi:3-dehydroquinate synthase